jgi:uncharacterized low-complexity protein
MKKFNLAALLFGAMLFISLGATTASAEGMKCGAGKCGSSMKKPATKCGADKKASTKCGGEKKAAMKCGAGKCGAEKKVEKKPMKCGAGKCGSK